MRRPQTNSQTASSAMQWPKSRVGAIRWARWPGVSAKSIYTWQKQFSRPAKVSPEVDGQAYGIRRLKRDLARVTKERDILKKTTAYFVRDAPSRGWKHPLPVAWQACLHAEKGAAGEVCVHCTEPADLCGPGDVFAAAGSSERLLCSAARAIKPPCV